jgi:hypothetical protein
MKRCGYCGKEHPDDAVVCAVDQQPFPSNAPLSSAPERVPIDMQAYLAARPRQVKLAVGILALNLAFDFIRIFIPIAMYRLSPSRHLHFYLITVFTFVMSGLLIYFIFLGKNWARWVMLSLMILGSASLFLPHNQMNWQSYAYFVIDILVLYLLFQRPSHQWFMKPKFLTENPLPAA